MYHSHPSIPFLLEVMSKNGAGLMEPDKRRAAIMAPLSLLQTSGAARALVTGVKLVMEGHLVKWAPCQKLKLVLFRPLYLEGPLSSLDLVL